MVEFKLIITTDQHIIDINEGTIYSRRLGKELTAYNNKGYKRVKIDGKAQLQHRYIYSLYHGKIPEGIDIDHINGIRDDNRIENLRLATREQNLQNKKVNVKGSKGIHFDKSRDKWAAAIRRNGGKIYLGRFVDAQDAQDAYNKRAKWYNDNENCFFTYGSIKN